ncbi:hypothetical protein CU098_011669, partial [Rhizopus stolonifer]
QAGNKTQTCQKKKHKAYLAIQRCQSGISSRNEELYCKKIAMRYNSQIAKKQETSTSSTKEEKEDLLFRFTSETSGVYEASECCLEELHKDSVFSETDIDVQGNKEYLDLTPELVISFTDIDVRTLQHKIRRKLERARKQIEEGKEVLQAETMLSEAPIITISTSIIQYQAFLDLHLSRSNRSRRFYSSKKE